MARGPEDEVANAEARAREGQWHERRRKRRAETAEAVRGDWQQANEAAAASPTTPWGKRHKRADGTGDSNGQREGKNGAEEGGNGDSAGK